MRFHSVESLDKLPVESDFYDLALFASGFEERAVFIAKEFKKSLAQKIIVLGFDNDLDVLSRRDNDHFFNEEFGVPIKLLDGTDDDSYLYGILNEQSSKVNNRPMRIFVDYSVMTRTWYGAILTWGRFAKEHRRIEIDFAYASGRYLDEFGPLSISEIISLPGFEGTSGGFRRTTAVFGLGYDKYATLAVYDRLEPDRIVCCIAQRFPNDESSKKALKENETLVEAADKLIELPLTDVPRAFGILAEQILGIERTTHIVIVPMGPKTHVLTTLLVALRMPWITCLHAKGARVSPVQVEADGEVGIARVIFEDQKNRRSVTE